MGHIVDRIRDACGETLHGGSVGKGFADVEAKLPFPEAGLHTFDRPPNVSIHVQHERGERFILPSEQPPFPSTVQNGYDAGGGALNQAIERSSLEPVDGLLQVTHFGVDSCFRSTFLDEVGELDELGVVPEAVFKYFAAWALSGGVTLNF